MKKYLLQFLSLTLTVLLVVFCTACGSTPDVGDTESVVEMVEYVDGEDETENETEETDTVSNDSSTKTSGKKSSKSKNGGYSVELNSENVAGDTKAQLALQKKLKDCGKGKSLTLLSTYGDDGLVNQCYIQMFKQLCGGELKIIRCSDWSGMQQKLASMHVAGNAPDLYEMTNQDFPSIMYRNIITKLSDKIDFNGDLYSDKDRELLSQLTWNGGIYFWPTMYDATGYRKGIWWNKNIFENAGIPKNQRPDALMKANNWTWDTMYELEKKLTDKNKGIFGFGAPENSSLSYGWLATTGEDFIKYTKDGIMSNMTSKNVTRAMNMFKKVYDTNYFVYEKAFDLFESGKVAMCYSSANNIASKKLNAMAKDGIAEVIPLPRDPQKNNYIIMGDITGLAIPSGSKNIDLAFNFIRMLRASDYYNDQVADIYHSQNGYTEQAIAYSNDCVTKYVTNPITSLGIKEILGVTWEAVGLNFVWGADTWETRAAEYSPKIQSILDKLG